MAESGTVAYGARTHLTLYLTSGYALLIIYASLYPLSGWRDSGGDPLAFLGAAWPRYWTCLLYTSPSPRDRTRSRMPSSA